MILHSIVELWFDVEEGYKTTSYTSKCDALAWSCGLM